MSDQAQAPPPVQPQSGSKKGKRKGKKGQQQQQLPTEVTPESVPVDAAPAETTPPQPEAASEPAPPEPSPEPVPEPAFEPEKAEEKAPEPQPVVAPEPVPEPEPVVEELTRDPSPPPRKASPPPRKVSPPPKKAPKAPKDDEASPSPRRSKTPRAESVDLPERRLPQVDTFQYDTDLDSKEDFALAAKLATLERKNQKLLDQSLIPKVEELEDKFFDSEETVATLRRKLQMAEEEASDFQALLEGREGQNALLRQDLDALQEKFDQEVTKKNTIEKERRKFESQIAVLEAEVEQNAAAVNKLQSALEEVDRLRQKSTELLNKNGELEQIAERRLGQISQLEKKLTAEMVRSREAHNKTVSDMEKLIEAERKRGQQAIDYVRNTLKSRIQVLELKLSDGSDTFATHKKEKRGLEKALKTTQKIVEDQRAQATRDARRIESLERQLKRSKERVDELIDTRNDLEAEVFATRRELDTLKAQYDGAIHINAKLNAQLPLSVRINIEEDELKKGPNAQTPASESGSSPL